MAQIRISIVEVVMGKDLVPKVMDLLVEVDFFNLETCKDKLTNISGSTRLDSFITVKQV